MFPLLGLSLAAFWIGVLAIGVYHGGYISEVVRSGVGSIHRGQFEAAKSQGFSYWQTMFVIVLPQALRIIMPPLAVQAANLVKNTSVLALIAGGELMYFSNSFAGATSYYGPVYVVAALLYFAVCFPLSRLALYLERRTRAHRHLATGDCDRELGEDPLEVTPGTHDITGRAAAEALAGGVGTMFETVDIAPARRAPSPRHPLHVLGEAPDGRGPMEQAFTGRVAAEIADEIGREIAPGDRRGMRRRRGVRRARHAHEGRPREGAPTARAARGRAPGSRRGCGIGERRRARNVRRRRGGSARLRGEGRLALSPGRRGARLARRDGCERPHQQRGAPPRRPGRRGTPCRRRVPRQRRRARSDAAAARTGGPETAGSDEAELEEEAARAEREADRAAREAEGASRGKEDR